MSGNRPAQIPNCSPDFEAGEARDCYCLGHIVELLAWGNCEALFQHLSTAATALSITPAMAARRRSRCPLFRRRNADRMRFDVHATRSGKVKFLFLQQGLKVLFPNQRVTLTNPDTDESITLVNAGQLRVSPTATGEITRFTGHNVVVGPGIGILYTTGNQTFVADADGTTTLTESQGEVLDVCEVLAP